MEFLVWVVDKGNTEPGGYLAGDVIVAKPDGHPWGYDEIHEDRWRVVRVDFDNVTDAVILENLNRIVTGKLSRREYGLDFTRLPAALAAQFVGPTAATVIVLTKSQAQSCVVRKT